MTQDTVVVTQSANRPHNNADMAFIAACRDSYDAGPVQFVPGYDQFGDLLSSAERAIAAAEQRGFKLCQDALEQCVNALRKHHEWHAAQTDPDPEHGFIPAVEYGDSTLHDLTIGALSTATAALTPPDHIADAGKMIPPASDEQCNCGLPKHGPGDHHEFCLFKPIRRWG